MRLIDADKLSATLEDWIKYLLQDGDMDGSVLLADVLLEIRDKSAKQPCNEPLTGWVRVEERTPEAGTYVACIAKRNPFSAYMPMVAKVLRNGWWNPVTEQYISTDRRPPEGEEEI